MCQAPYSMQTCQMGIIISNVQMKKLRLREIGQVVVYVTDAGSEPRSKAWPFHPLCQTISAFLSLEASEGGVCAVCVGLERKEKEWFRGIHLSFFCHLSSSFRSASLVHKLEVVAGS